MSFIKRQNVILLFQYLSQLYVLMLVIVLSVMLLISGIGQRSDWVLSWMDPSLSQHVSWKKLKFHWAGSSPIIVLENVQVHEDQYVPLSIHMRQFLLEINILDTLLSQQWKFKRVLGMGGNLTWGGHFQDKMLDISSLFSQVIVQHAHIQWLSMFDQMRFVRLKATLPKLGHFWVNEFKLNRLRKAELAWDLVGRQSLGSSSAQFQARGAFAIKQGGRGQLSHLALNIMQQHGQFIVGQHQLKTDAAQLQLLAQRNQDHIHLDGHVVTRALQVRSRGSVDNYGHHTVYFRGSLLEDGSIDMQFVSRHRNPKVQMHWVRKILGPSNVFQDHFKLNHVEMQSLYAWVKRFPKLIEATRLDHIWRQWKPQAHLVHFEMLLNHTAQQMHWQWLSGRFNQGHITHSKGSLSNLSGTFLLKHQRGELQLDTSSMILIRPLSGQKKQRWIATQPIKVIWLHTPQHDELRARMKQICIHDAQCISLALDRHQDRAHPHQDGFNLDLEGHHLDWHHIRTWLPVQAFSPELRAWLSSAVLQGHIDEGLLQLRWPLSDLKDDVKFKFSARVSDVELQYLKNWPFLKHGKGHMLLTDQHLDLVNASGCLMDQQLPVKFVARISDFNKQASLHFVMRASDPIERWEPWLSKTPLRTVLGRLFNQLKPQGSGALNLVLDLDLDSLSDRWPYRAQLDLKGIRFLKAWPKRLRDLQGQLILTDQGVYSKNLSAQLDHKPMKLSVQTKGLKRHKKVYLIASAQVSLMDYLRDFCAQDCIFKGFSDWRLSAQHIWDDWHLPWAVQLSSNLIGTQIHLKDWIEKSSQVPMKINVLGQLSEDNQDWLFKMPAVGIAHISLPKQGRLSGQISLGKAARLTSNAGIQGWSLHAFLPQWPAAWTRWIQRYAHKKSSDAQMIQFQGGFDQVKWGHVCIDNVKVQGEYAPAKVKVNVTSPRLNALVSQHLESSQPEWNIHVQHWQPKLADFKPTSQAQGFAFQQANLQIDALQLPKLTLHNITLNLKQIQRHLWLLDKIRINDSLGRAQATAQLRLAPHPEFSTTGQIVFNDFGQLLKQQGVSSHLEHTHGTLDFNVKAMPTGSSSLWACSDGLFSLHLNQGRWIIDDLELEKKLSLGRLLTALSVSSLQRRLSLNFDDWLESGFHFDTLSGHLHLSQQRLSTDDLSIQGPSAGLHYIGDLILKSGQYDGILSVQPKLTSSLPILTALAVSPPAGALMWLADHFFLSQLPKIERFNIKGFWYAPRIQRITGPSQASIENRSGVFNESSDG